MPQRRFARIEDVFRALEEHFLPEKAEETDVTVQLHITGEGGGDWYIRIQRGSLQVHPGVAEDHPDLSITTSAEDYLALVNGEMDPIGAYMRGRVKAQGNLRLVYRLQFLFRLPEDLRE